ncbi:DEAD/DEAH box helicase [Kiloniella laminariae]|uniref:DEAD/DEAH box helicase n=1 Tax=Kiloniella laminariae TaxID=454162 RepID=A0ABT4LNT7_9PROT|nr:DEAD/DEAH box helicase [Kiloniella laminariae]MCZ4282555.1 DEAD/DEAH box helicase [Kiloniella laminariae]
MSESSAHFEGVLPPLGQALGKRGYQALTPVQQAVLAPELADADALVSAQTGSGKTVAFGLAIAPTLLDGAERFSRAQVPLALVIAPTRELALQVKSELDWLYEMTGASVTSCVGGMDMRSERRELDRGVHIVVGTPGRLRDHIERGSLDVTALRAVVLDEADEMLDMGFRDDLEYILDTTPEDRRTLLFSATVPRSILGLAKRYQRNAVRLSTAAEEKQHLDIEYRALTVAPNDRENAIINLVRYYEPKNAIVFCATRLTVSHLASRLTNRGFAVVALSGELSQAQRSHALQAMRDGRAQICVATDVAARGIDLPNLELVIHADIPKGAEPLLHRSGRTGRAGRKGVSALIVPHNWRKRTERLLDNANVVATWAKTPSVEDIIERDRERFLANPALNEPVKEDELAFVQELLSRYSAEQVAAALVRLNHAGLPAPEELLDTPEPRQAREGRDRSDRGERSSSNDRGNRQDRRDREQSDVPRKQRQDFTDGVWISVSVGRKHTAEPRWLLPMLCRAGHVTKNEIGAIRIYESESFIEIASDSVDQFFTALGPSSKMEKTISVKRLEGTPDDEVATFRSSRGEERGKRERHEREDGSDETKKSGRSGASHFRDSFNAKSEKRDFGKGSWSADRRPKEPVKAGKVDLKALASNIEEKNSKSALNYDSANKRSSKPAKKSFDKPRAAKEFSPMSGDKKPGAARTGVGKADRPVKKTQPSETEGPSDAGEIFTRKPRFDKTGSAGKGKSGKGAAGKPGFARKAKDKTGSTTLKRKKPKA